MKKFTMVAAVAIALGAAAPALAADLPARTYTKALAMIPSPIYEWSGFYIGINGGGGFSHKCWDLDVDPGGPLGPEGCHDASGGTLGGQIGYRWQMATWVFGLEAQGNWADFTGSNVSLAVLNTTNQTRINAFGLFTGQIGYAWDRALFYVKGGAAVTDNKFTSITTGLGGGVDFASQTRWGPSVGVGFAYAFAPNL